MATEIEYADKIKTISEKNPPDDLHLSATQTALIQGLLANSVETGLLLNQIKKAVFHGQEVVVNSPVELPTVSPLVLTSQDAQLLEAVLGVMGEAAELSQMLYLNLKFGELVDQKETCKEMGDLQFYVTKMANLVGLSSEEIRDENLERISSGYTGRLENTHD